MSASCPLSFRLRTKAAPSEIDDDSRDLLAALISIVGSQAGARRDAMGAPMLGRRAGKMTEEEAYQILGLQPRASPEEISRAHRSLIKKLHPDQGGTTYLSARINEARDVRLPVRVINGKFAKSSRCPLYPRKRTFVSTIVISVLCYFRTYRIAAKNLIRTLHEHGRACLIRPKTQRNRRRGSEPPWAEDEPANRMLRRA